MALLQATGKVNLLRVHDVGTGFGGPGDQIDVEVVARLSTQQGRSMGFQLRNDADRAARQGMLDLLRDAFEHNHDATIDFDLPDGKTNGVIIRVALTK
jgi:hypothetical protein